jgi:hypothetical protein
MACNGTALLYFYMRSLNAVRCLSTPKSECNSVINCTRNRKYNPQILDCYTKAGLLLPLFDWLSILYWQLKLYRCQFWSSRLDFNYRCNWSTVQWFYGGRRVLTAHKLTLVECILTNLTFKESVGLLAAYQSMQTVCSTALWYRR